MLKYDDARQRSPAEQFARRGITLVELLCCVLLIFVCIALLRPALSQSRARLLAEGVLLWHGQPVVGATVEFHPVLEGDRLGPPSRYAAQDSLCTGRTLVVLSGQSRYNSARCLRPTSANGSTRKFTRMIR